MENASSTALAIRRTQQELKNMEASEANAIEDTALKKTQQDVNRANRNLLMTQEGVANNTSRLVNWQANKAFWEASTAKEILHQTRAQTPGALTEGEIDKSKYGEFTRWLNRLNPFGSTVKKLVPYK